MKLQSPSFDLRSRATAAGAHLAISALIAAAAAALVFGLWYPWPYRVVSGGQSLFFLVVAVDVVMGPLLTFVVFDRAKGWRHLARDLAVIAALQLAALVYGLYTVYVVRPVAMVFEVERFRVITASDVHAPELPKARPEYRRLPLTGPWLLGARPPRQGEERNEAIMMGLQGIDVSQRPIFWQPYTESRSAALARSRPVTALMERYPARKAELEAVLSQLRLSAADARFLPLMARQDWVVILDAAGDVAGYAPFDGFF